MLTSFNSPMAKRRIFTSSIKGGRKQPTAMDTKLRQLYDAIRDYREPKAQRQLALIFMKLPSKSVSSFYEIDTCVLVTKI